MPVVTSTAVADNKTKFLVKAIYDAVGYNEYSVNKIKQTCKKGHTYARELMEQLEALGVVGSEDGTNPREVLVKSLDNLSEEARDVLLDAKYSIADVMNRIEHKE